MSDWHNKIHEELGWFEKLRQRKIANGDICGGCGEWPEFCGCKDCSCCNASISGTCLAITMNEPFCYPECGRMEARNENGGV